MSRPLSRSRLIPLAGLALLGSLVLAPARADAGPRPDLPPVVTAASPALYPEGVAWDPTRRAFLVGSARFGTVSVLRPDGRLRTLVDDPRLVSSFGLTVDARRGRLLVAFGDVGVAERSAPEGSPRPAGLAAYDLSSGRPLFRTEIPAPDGPAAANDVTVGPDGTAYVTDSFGDAIVRIDRRGRVTGRFTDPRWVSDGFGVNGIVFHPDGYLISVRYDAGRLFRISPVTGRVDEVALPSPVAGGDGLGLRRDGTLVVVTNGVGTAATDAVRLLRSDDGWTSAREVRTVPWPDRDPSTVAITPRGSYVLGSSLSALLGGDLSVERFPVRRVVS